jgi:hypothetical protein
MVRYWHSTAPQGSTSAQSLSLAERPPQTTGDLRGSRHARVKCGRSQPRFRGWHGRAVRCCRRHWSGDCDGKGYR